MEIEGDSQVNLHKRLCEMIDGDMLGYDSWASLISEIEKMHPDNIDMISTAYDSFLSKFPLCHWYWKKYAYHKARLCTIATAVEIFERAVEASTFSIGFWLDYCTFSETFFKEPSDIRRIYERGISFVGKDYFCHVLWDRYLQFECTQQQLGIIAHVYIQILKFPTKKLNFYYVSFQEFVTILEEEIRCQSNFSSNVDPEDAPDVAIEISKVDISHVIKDLQDLSNGPRRSRALHRYKTIGDQFYKKALQLDQKIKMFEAKVRRRYFQVTPLGEDELNNWHQYLDFIEKQEDFDWALKLYERCLIPCANYPEFWMRYVEYMETKRGRPLAIFALDRATRIFLKNVPEIHLFSARFRERIGDSTGARDAYFQCNACSGAYVIENVVRQANMEKRLGNFGAASEIYEKAIKAAVDQQKMQDLPSLYIQFSRLKYTITGSVIAARDVIVDGIRQIPYCRLLFEELMKFAMTHEGARHISVVESLVAEIISGSEASGGFHTKDRVDISCLYLEFVDLCGSPNDIRKAWDRHFRLFPQFIRQNPYKDPARGYNLVNEFKEQDGKLGTFPNQLPQGLKSVVDFQIPEQEPSPDIDNYMQPDQIYVDQSKLEDDEHHCHESALNFSPKVALLPREDLAGMSLLNQNQGHGSRGDASGVSDSAVDSIQPHEVINGRTESINDPDHRNGPKECESTFDFGQQSTPLGKPLQELSSTLVMLQEPNDKLGQDLKMVSFGNLSLNSREKESPELIDVTLGKNPATEVNCPSKDSTPIGSLDVENDKLDCPKINQGSYSAEGRHEPQEKKPNALSSVSEENQILPEAYPDSTVSPSTSENSHRVNCTARDSRSGSSGSYDHSLDRLQQMQKSASPQQSGSAEMVPRMHTDRGWPQQLSVSEEGSIEQGQSQLSSPPISHPLLYMPQQTMPSGRQVGEAINQMFQYQHQQQHELQQQYQQNMSQTQQPYFHLQYQHQQQLHPQQQQNQMLSPFPQQQYYVQQQQQFQSPPYQSQQQMSYLQQAQVQQQSWLQGYQPYQQHTGQAYHSMFHQHQLYQQGYYQMQHQQQWEGYHQTQEQLENNQCDQQQQDTE